MTDVSLFQEGGLDTLLPLPRASPGQFRSGTMAWRVGNRDKVDRFEDGLFSFMSQGTPITHPFLPAPEAGAPFANF